jgi:hypothetical protein
MIDLYHSRWKLQARLQSLCNVLVAHLFCLLPPPALCTCKEQTLTTTKRHSRLGLIGTVSSELDHHKSPYTDHHKARSSGSLFCQLSNLRSNCHFFNTHCPESPVTIESTHSPESGHAKSKQSPILTVIPKRERVSRCVCRHDLVRHGLGEEHSKAPSLQFRTSRQLTDKLKLIQERGMQHLNQTICRTTWHAGLRSLHSIYTKMYVSVRWIPLCNDG